MSFAEALQALRKQAGLTQRELASRVEISLSLMEKLERGWRDPSPQTATRLGMALELPPTASIAFLAIAGFAADEHREAASEDLRAYLRSTTNGNAPQE